MQKITLIGKGLVAKHLVQQFNDFEIKQFDSKNVHDLRKEEHDVVFCAAPSAKKWIANASPKIDEDNCLSLIDHLTSSKIRKIYHFSTVDVFNDPSNVNNELCDEYSNHAYGKNRRMIERALLDHFDASVIRLPALFGKFLEKNYMFDLMNSNNLHEIRSNSSFQWFDLRHLKSIIEFSEKINILNLSTEPINTSEIIETFFPDKLSSVNNVNQGPRYNMKSGFFESGYYLSKDQTLNDIKEFIHDWDNDGRSSN